MINSTKIAPEMQEGKNKPSEKALQFILNYSKSLEAKKVKEETFLIHLN